ncbi:prepilin-type N-terminal cleavage/methylation domain-containing protein, partial [bacterium]|nr:prepilin-type N-terminal cleavage/methylation domain-containing protein [bacterium]
MRKKGFTLIELLAVIVILAIIALITTPTILGVIETAKKGVFRDSIYGLMDATNVYMAQNLETGTMEFICDGTDCELENGDKLSFKGETPKSGMIKVDKDHKISVEYISNGTYCAYGTLENLVIDKDCEQLDTTKPVLDDSKLNVTTTTSSLTVNILKGFAKDPESGIKEYKVTVNGETKTLKEIGTLTFDGLDKNKAYEIKIEVENGKGLKSELIKEYTTLQFLSPSITLTNTPTTAVNGYLKSQVAKITYNGTNITSPKYFVKTTREGTSSLAVTATCGTGTTPSTCTNVTSTKTLTANTWYQVSGNVNV